MHGKGREREVDRSNERIMREKGYTAGREGYYVGGLRLGKIEVEKLRGQTAVKKERCNSSLHCVLF